MTCEKCDKDCTSYCQCDMCYQITCKDCLHVYTSKDGTLFLDYPHLCTACFKEQEDK